MKISKKDINLYDTLFSGQCFRMTMEEDDSFTVILSDRVVNIKEEKEYLEVDSNKLEDLDLVVNSYLDLERDYDKINKELVSNCDIFKSNINLCEGYKILKQDKFEMFITYIISQNNRVSKIINSVDKLCKAYGEKVVFREKEYYLFPKFENIQDISLEELRCFGVGFRDKYIKNALDFLKKRKTFLDEIDFMNTKDAIKELTSIKGIGIKVASCILLFGYSRFDTFPIDTWVKKFVSNNFNVKDNINEISRYMEKTFGENSGIAIQYFYHIERNKKEIKVYS